MTEGHAIRKRWDTLRTGSAEDFVDAGPFELFLLLSATLILVATHVALPKLLAQIYGQTAARLFLPLWPLLLLGCLFSIAPAKRPSSAPTILTGTTAFLWAVFLRYGTEYFARDVDILRAAFDAWPTIIGAVTGGTVSVASIPSYWAPVLGSTVVEVFFEGLLTMTMTSMLRQRSRKTRIPAIIPASVMVLIGVLATSVLTPRLAHSVVIFCTVPVLAFLAVIGARSLRVFLVCGTLAAASIYLLSSTVTLSCASMPSLLKCPTNIGDFAVKASADSLTGRITVVQNEKYKLLVADHSLLGGEWLGAGIGQSIFVTFYMQSLAVYAFSPPRTSVRVLQIGLGIGTATKSLLGLSTFGPQGSGKLQIDVVEIDPVVVENAHAYFALPRPSEEPRLRTFVMDASDFVETAQNSTYDLISHDIFTGGVTAFPLFTTEFFAALKSKLNPGGILTVNYVYVYAPTIARTNFESVLDTLRANFEHVTVYIETGKTNAVNNLVFYCSDLRTKLEVPVSVASPNTNLGRAAREMRHWVLREADAVVHDASRVLHDEAVDDGASRARYRPGAERMALRHWEFMRALLPPPEDLLWITF